MNDTDNSNFAIHANSDRLYFMRDTDDDFTYNDGEDDRVVMSGTGGITKVGIHTSAPTHDLDVRGPVRIDHESGTYDM